LNSEHLKAIHWTESNKKSLTKTLNTLKSIKGFDQRIQTAHNQAFGEIDCLECGNCCRTTGPLLVHSDIDKIARKQKLSSKEFIARHLRVDEDGDFVFNSMPCPFLGTDNYCSIYSYRPKACREYPHTDQKGQAAILHLTRKNAKICPAVSKILKIVHELG
jgi:Fe-S-cluster containining protein